MKNEQEKIENQFEKVSNIADDIINNSDEYSKEELKNARAAISSVILEAEAKLKAFKEKKVASHS